MSVASRGCEPYAIKNKFCTKLEIIKLKALSSFGVLQLQKISERAK